MKRLCGIIIVACLSVLMSLAAYSQKFIHPGIDQSSEDLAYMKKQVLSGNQPWKDAFDRLKASTDLNSAVKPFAHVQRGPYGKPNIGGGELSQNANLAYNCAFVCLNHARFSGSPL